MFKIPLSATPFNSTQLKSVLDSYHNRPVMDVVADFESQLKLYTGSPFVLALNSGTSAIHLGLKALGVGVGDFVIVPTFTYVATLNPVLYLGAEPILVDSEPESWNMDPQLLEKAILECGVRKKPKCIILVHNYGMPANLQAIKEICSTYKIPMLEDAAEALGAVSDNSVAGTSGEIGVLSFNNNKILTTYGGGVLLTENEEFYKKALFWASQSREDKPFYEHSAVGFNYRMGPLNAASGLVGLKELEKALVRRQTIFEVYKQSFQYLGVEVTYQQGGPSTKSNRWLSCFNFKTLNISDISINLQSSGIECRRLWKPMHQQPLFQDFKAYLNAVSDGLFSSGISLPSSVSLSDFEIDNIASIVAKAK